jgi:hypothetical protein
VDVSRDPAARSSADARARLERFGDWQARQHLGPAVVRGEQPGAIERRDAVHVAGDDLRRGDRRFDGQPHRGRPPTPDDGTLTVGSETITQAG